MITDVTLRGIQDNLMASMTALYVEDKDDQFARALAAAMIEIHEAIDIELMERMMSR